MPKLDVFKFVEGRDAYINKQPLLDILGRIDALDEKRDGEAAESFMFGFLDGALADLRDCAQNAREEMAQRGTPASSVIR